jgi:hypothetical protein
VGEALWLQHRLVLRGATDCLSHRGMGGKAGKEGDHEAAHEKGGKGGKAGVGGKEGKAEGKAAEAGRIV